MKTAIDLPAIYSACCCLISIFYAGTGGTVLVPCYRGARTVGWLEVVKASTELADEFL